jgi:hypothetical protein
MTFAALKALRARELFLMTLSDTHAHYGNIIIIVEPCQAIVNNMAKNGSIAHVSVDAKKEPL